MTNGDSSLITDGATLVKQEERKKTKSTSLVKDACDALKEKECWVYLHATNAGKTLVQFNHNGY